MAAATKPRVSDKRLFEIYANAESCAATSEASQVVRDLRDARDTIAIQSEALILKDAEIERLTHLVADIEAAMAAKEAEIERLKREIKDRTDERQILQDQLNRALLHCRDYQTDLTAAKATIASHAEALAEVRGDLEDCQIDKAGWEVALEERTAQLVAAEAALKAAREAIIWALGESGEFPLRGPNDGAYWWRKDLRKRAAIAKEPTP